MKEIIQYLFIAKLICKERIAGLDDSEKRQLDSWRSESKEKEHVFLNLQRISTEELEKRYDGVDVDLKWKSFKKRQQQRKRNIRVGVAVAASVCLLITSVLWLWLGTLGEERVVLAEQGQQNNVCLVLSTGEVVDISNVGQDEVKLDKGTKLYEGNRLEYVQPDSLHKKELEFNQLIIPKGTFYHLVLSDGTKVWLNADSKIKYPVSFGQDKREVSLRGEGYFEVAKDSSRPFIVSTDKMDVKVLGTTFDVNTYEDEGKSFVVLVEGLVEVSAGKGESRIITPGYMAEVNMHDVQAKIHVSKCDTEHYIAWKSGNFSFRNASLTEILKRVSRYYDVTVIREQVFEEEYYTGDVSSDVSLESLLAVIESSTSVSFKVERKIVYVQKKRD
ncbi:FecR family protein [Butyricimonas faecalis]|uniref:FecR family protein n=1 Tax=Butyricimonas faecalis TaxID=2093856 RepID=A0A3Q9IPE7_9BACT|nr:FecR family protein [Butyricimonas faecalis]AZS30649.1 FecR family protein [Butyricimonas faecalis]